MVSKLKLVLITTAFFITSNLFANIVIEIKIIKLGEREHQLQKTIISELMKNKVPFTLGETRTNQKKFLHIEVIGGNPSSLNMDFRTAKGKVRHLKTTMKSNELNNRVVQEIKKALSQIKE